MRQVLSVQRQVPSIRARRGCIVFCFPPLTAFVIHSRVLLLVTEDVSVTDTLVETLRDLTRSYSIKDPTPSSIKHKGVPFEFAAFETLLTAAFEEVQRTIESFEAEVHLVKAHVEARQTQPDDIQAMNV
eukprot:GHVO01068863.1.p1 GENE.GHVO01068863.1~~GHVO01068863.1.p1  ORF type:complete len:129 (-),score=17.53 GHVO01068863.1:362-748(-)